ncbi:galactose-3-O-sulfotransferase 2-like, partial [Eriocheir sinensis]|uniref:galactose-3-O-sulfotransferase 2-like n=1 Tax=Eriocheir sinensis TaxID=95602 RepID=UPI0021C7B7A9
HRGFGQLLFLLNSSSFHLPLPPPPPPSLKLTPSSSISTSITTTTNTPSSSSPTQDLASLPRLGNKLGRNQMLFDLGYSPELGVADLRRAIDELDARFDIVLISERMDESLILLRHLLCWNLSDIVVFTKNARRTEVKPGLDAKTLHALRELNSADVILYEHFLARHKEAVHAFGENRMKEEIATLRGLRDEFYEECGLREVKGRDKELKFKEYSGLVSSYTVNNTNDTTCLILSMPELPLVQMTRGRQEVMLKEEKEEEEEKKKKVERRSSGGGGDSGGSGPAPPPPPPPPPPPSSRLGNT